MGARWLPMSLHLLPSSANDDTILVQGHPGIIRNCPSNAIFEPTHAWWEPKGPWMWDQGPPPLGRGYVGGHMVAAQSQLGFIYPLHPSGPNFQATTKGAGLVSPFWNSKQPRVCITLFIFNCEQSPGVVRSKASMSDPHSDNVLG